MQAVIRTGGKQYLVTVGQELSVERLPGSVGDAVAFDDILLTEKNGAVTLGRPTVKGAVVEAKILKQARLPKITVTKFKSKVRYRRKAGHRQHYTRVAITGITAP